MTPCNFCKLRDIRLFSKERGLKVTVLSDAGWGMGGKNIYVHPVDVKIAELSGGEDGVRSRYRQSWMMYIPHKCAC